MLGRLWTCMAVCVTRVQADIYRVVHLSKYVIGREFIWRSNTFGISFSQKRLLCSNSSMETVKASLVSIFRRGLVSVESPALQGLGSRLTPQIVETVLKSLESWRSAFLFFEWASRQKGYFHNCYAFNAMAAILSNARQKEQLKILSENVLHSKCYWTPGAFGYFLRCLGSQDLIVEANNLFDQVRILGLCNLNSYSYNCLLEVIAKGSDASLLEYRLNERKSLGWPIDKYALTPALQCYCNAGMFDKAMLIFNELSGKGYVDHHILAILVLSYSKCGEVDKVFAMIEWSEENLKISLNEKTFCILIHGFSRMGRVDKSLELYLKMKKLGYQPDIAAYDVLIKGLCKISDTGTACKLIEHMKESGVSPDTQIVFHLISCIHDGGELSQFLEDTWKDLDEAKGMLLCSSVVKALLRDCHVEKAYHLLKVVFGSDMNEMSKAMKINLEIQKLGTSCFEIVIDALCAHNLFDMALDLFQDMSKNGCIRSVRLFNDIINCLSSADRLTECSDLLNEMKQMEFRPTHFTFNCILGCLCRRGDAAGSLAMLREMRTYGYEPWIKNYSALVKKLCENGRLVDASSFLSDMSKEGFLPDLIAYSVVIDGFIYNDEWDLGLKLFSDIRERGYHPDVVSYNTIIKGLCKAKRMSEAEKMVDEIIINGLIPSVVTYNSLIDGWCKDGDTDRAIQLFYKMRVEGLEPNVITFTSLVDGLCNAGKPEEALRFWKEMEDKQCAANRIAYMSLINGLCKCGKPDLAFLYLQDMERKEMVPDPYVYIALLDSFASHSNTTMVNEVQKMMALLGLA